MNIINGAPRNLKPDNAAEMLRKGHAYFMDLMTRNEVIAAKVVGSATIPGIRRCNDVDVLVLIEHDSTQPLVQQVAALFPNSVPCSESSYQTGVGSTWWAIRDGDVNLLVHTDIVLYQKWSTANDVCVALRLTKREDRVVAYGVIADGRNPDDARAAAGLPL